MYCLVQTPGGCEALIPLPTIERSRSRPHCRCTAGVNYVDFYYRERKYKTPLPFTPGIEGAGHVKALAEGASDFPIVGAVVWFGPLGSYAGKAVVPIHWLLKIPDRNAARYFCGAEQSRPDRISA